jgi:hypothetical protein
MDLAESRDFALRCVLFPWNKHQPRQAPPDASEKAVIISACEAFIGDVLKPRFLP